MKTMYQNMLAAVLPLVGILTACTDQNEWSKDGANTSIIANRLYTPSWDTEKVVVDSATFNIEAPFEKVKGAEGYQVQISEEPLSEGEDETQGIATFSGTKSPIIIPQSSEQIVIKENTTYYVRLRAIAEGKTSRWYTDGILKGTFKVNTPANLFIESAGIDANDLTLKWNQNLAPYKDGKTNKKERYCTIKSIRNVTTGATVDLSDADFQAGEYKWTGLSIETEYSFELLDTEGNVIGKVTESTEKVPMLAWAREIKPLNKAEWGNGGTKFPANESVEFADRSFKVTFHDYQTKFKGEMKDISLMNPQKETMAKETLYRFNTNSTNFAKKPEDASKCYIKIEIPASGRLYINAYHGSEKMSLDIVDPDDPSKFKKFGEGNDKALFDKVSIPTGEIIDGNGAKVLPFVKFKLTQAGTYYLSGKFYIYAFVFVPDTELPAGM